MKRIFYSIFCLSLSTVLVMGKSAGKVSTGKESDKQVSAILAKIDNASRRIRTYSASFNQVDVEPAFDEITMSSGRFHLMRKTIPDQRDPVYLLRFDYTKPERSVTIINDAKVLLFKPGMIKPQESMMVDNIKLQALFAGFMSTKSLQEHYEIFLTDNDAASISLLLNPKTETARSNFKELRITFSKSSWLPTTIVQHKIGGQQITMTFKNPQVNRTLNKKIFTAESLKEIKAPVRRKKSSAGKKPADR
jgi:outer membrane lipoprotein-sorting protein